MATAPKHNLTVDDAGAIVRYLGMQGSLSPQEAFNFLSAQLVLHENLLEMLRDEVQALARRVIALESKENT